MENATKALLISAGVLMAMMVLSLLVIGYNGISSYYREKQASMTQEQLIAFNKQYEAYNRDDVTGFELVSLINKIIDYNANNAVDETLGFNNTDEYYEKMYIEFTLTGDASEKKLFKQSTYNSEYSKQNNELERIIKAMNNLEKEYSSGVMSKFASATNYDPDDKKTVSEILGVDEGKVPSKLPTIEEVQQYQEYIDFKRADFECTETKYNDQTRRIVKLIFVQK